MRHISNTPRRMVLALPYIALLTILIGFGQNLAWSPYKFDRTVVEGGKTKVVHETIGHYYQVSSFWLPGGLVLGLALILLLMYVVSHERTRRWPGTLIGFFTAVVALIFGRHLIPSDINTDVLVRGLLLMALLLVSMLFMALYGFTAAKWAPPNNQ